MHRLLSYGNENDNGYDKHLRSQTDLQTLGFLKLIFTLKSISFNPELRIYVPQKNALSLFPLNVVVIGFEQ